MTTERNTLDVLTAVSDLYRQATLIEQASPLTADWLRTFADVLTDYPRTSAPKLVERAVESMTSIEVAS
jgi:hypothetical protein